MTIDIRPADYDHPSDQRAIVDLLNMYAGDAMGNGQPLSADAQRNVVAGLQNHPTARVFLAWAGAEAVGIAVCFLGYSTFAARPLLNLHDFAVRPDFRRRGIGERLMAQVEQAARQLGCCKVTLEVQQDNHAAQRLYRRCGFGDMYGTTHFWAKPLDGL